MCLCKGSIQFDPYPLILKASAAEAETLPLFRGELASKEVVSVQYRSCEDIFCLKIDNKHICQVSFVQGCGKDGALRFINKIGKMVCQGSIKATKARHITPH